MAIKDIRIDDRLIHGQVCSNWIPFYSLDRIAVVDDVIAKDEQRKSLLKLGCPSRCKVSIFSADAAADKFMRGIDKGINVMILCTSPQPLVEMTNAGFAIDHVTIGNMSTKCDAEQIQNNTFVSPEEKTDFETLVASGTRLYLWTVPSEVKQEITTLYRKVKE